jgi:hypothetical protein
LWNENDVIFSFPELLKSNLGVEKIKAFDSCPN